MTNDTTITAHVDQLHQFGAVDMHFDLLMDLYENRDRTHVLDNDYLPDLQAGGMGVLGVAIYLEDKYLPEMGLRVALDQIARLYAEVATTQHFAICKSYADIVAARQANKIALLITMEGVEPLGTDINLAACFLRTGGAQYWLNPCAAQHGGRWRRFCAERFLAPRLDRFWQGGRSAM